MNEKAKKDGIAQYAYAMDLCRTLLYQTENCVDVFLNVQMSICETGASLNNVTHLFAKRKSVNIPSQDNALLLKSHEDTGIQENEPLETWNTKQRSKIWFNARKTFKVTGSTIYEAVWVWRP